MKLTFLIQGSTKEPYEVSFWKDGRNLTTSCTCEAGKNSLSCKHRFAMMDADVTNLVSGNIEDVSRLQQMIMDTDVAEAYEPVLNAISAQNFINSKCGLRPTGKRTHIEVTVAISLLQAGGIMKGNGGTNYLDVYDKENNYHGSIKTPLSVFNTDIEKLIPGIPLRSIIRTDRQIHERSQGIYYYLDGSEFDKAISSESGISEAKRHLRKAMKD